MTATVTAPVTATGHPTPAIPANAALLLDVDGTLLDIAPTPTSVHVPPGLPASLAALSSRLGGAVALVTGRPIEQVDALFPALVTAVAGEHGGAIRHSPAGPVERPPLATLPPGWLATAETLAGATAGVLLERKSHGFVLHYRLAPAAGPGLYTAILGLLKAHAENFTVLAARMAWEVKPLGADKGTAVRSLMARAPFAGRIPIYVGDDTTDEDGMRAAIALGGLGLRVQDVFVDPAGVRAWLDREVAVAPDPNPAFR